MIAVGIIHSLKMVVLRIVSGVILNYRICFEAVSVGLYYPIRMLKKVSKPDGAEQDRQYQNGQAAKYFSTLHAGHCKVRQDSTLVVDPLDRPGGFFLEKFVASTL